MYILLYAGKNVSAPDDLDEYTLVGKEIDAVLTRAALCVVPCMRLSMIVLLLLLLVLLFDCCIRIVGCCCSHRGRQHVGDVVAV